MQTPSQGTDEIENLTYLSGVINDVEDDENFDRDGDELGNHWLRADTLEEETEALIVENFLSEI